MPKPRPNMPAAPHPKQRPPVPQQRQDVSPPPKLMTATLLLDPAQGGARLPFTDFYAWIADTERGEALILWDQDGVLFSRHKDRAVAMRDRAEAAVAANVRLVRFLIGRP